MSIQSTFKKIFSRKKREPRLDASDEDFIVDSRKAMLSKTTPVTHIILYSVIGFILICLILSYFTKIDSLTVGSGKVIPSSQVKSIQSLDGGIVAKIFVKEGEIVKKDQILIKLDETRYKAEYESGHAKYIVLQGMLARLLAEQQGKDSITFPKEVLNHPEIVASETAFFNTRKKALTEKLAALQESFEIANKQTKMYESLLSRGYSSRLDYLRSLQNTTDFKTKIITTKNDFISEVNENLTKYGGDLKQVTEQLASLKDKMTRTNIYSPVYGIVKKINFYTIGGVIEPGKDIMEIVPLTDTLLIEARIKPSNIAFIKVGQPATVKITAYDYAIYGSLPGVVEYISADTVVEDKNPSPVRTQAQSDEEAHYLVHIRVARNYLGGEKHKLYILPGMQATVHIKTREITVLQYILKPLIKAKEESLRER